MPAARTPASARAAHDIADRRSPGFNGCAFAASLPSHKPLPCLSRRKQWGPRRGRVEFLELRDVPDGG